MKAVEVHRYYLAQGVQHVFCDYVGTLEHASLPKHIETLIQRARPKGTKITSVEVYANGAVNARVRLFDDAIDQLLGFIQLRRIDD